MLVEIAHKAAGVMELLKHVGSSTDIDKETLGLVGMSLEEFVEELVPVSLEKARARPVEDYGLVEDVADINLLKWTVEAARNDCYPQLALEKATTTPG